MEVHPRRYVDGVAEDVVSKLRAPDDTGDDSANGDAGLALQRNPELAAVRLDLAPG